MKLVIASNAVQSAMELTYNFIILTIALVGPIIFKYVKAFLKKKYHQKFGTKRSNSRPVFKLPANTEENRVDCSCDDVELQPLKGIPPPSVLASRWQESQTTQTNLQLV